MTVASANSMDMNNALEGPLPPLISVITAVRNGEKFLAETLDSVIAQSYSRWEYLVIDVGSSDGTLDVVRAYAPHLAYWVSEPDSGISDAFNKGVAKAKGDYLLFLNSDDLLAEPSALATVARAAAEAGMPSLVCADCMVVSREELRPLYAVSRHFSPLSFTWGHAPPHPSLFVHRRYFERYGLYDVTFHIAMDLELLARGIMREPVIHIPYVATKMREGGISMREHSLSMQETTRALAKNGLIHPMLGAWRLRGYYALRAIARKVMTCTGVYRYWRPASPRQ
jgi:glycosyltransferase involved in cell wall biosynthesis